jgi:hypothetical protein
MRVGKWSVGFLAALSMTFVIAAAGAMAKGGNSATGYQVGTPWTGQAGVQRTTAEIMVEQPANGGSPTPRVVRAHKVDFRLSPNPSSPPVGGSKTNQALSGPKALTVGSSFTGATLAADSIFVPPDSMGAVGPTQFLVAVNGRIRVFSKAGAVGTLNATLDTFFSSVVTSGAVTSDPRVRYDSLSGKWFVTSIDTGDVSGVNNRVLLAVSNGSTIDNSTVWSFFQFQQDLPSPTGDSNDFADFDTLGIDANALYMGANVFDGSGSFVNSTGFVIRKSSVTSGGPIVVTAFRHLLDGSSNGPYTPQGVDNVDPAVLHRGRWKRLRGP